MPRAHDRETVKRMKEVERGLAVLLKNLEQYPLEKRGALLSKIRKDATSELRALGLGLDDVDTFVSRTCVLPKTEEDEDAGLEVGVWDA